MNETEQKSWKDFIPLIVVVGLSALTAAVLQAGTSVWSWTGFMRYFMGLYLISFSMFKLFDITSFADGFAMYDLLAKRARPYALSYPFIELVLGMAYLAGFMLAVTNVIVLVLMVFGATGVTLSLQKGMNIKCACMGTVLKVPLSTVTVIENGGMGIMALTMLIIIN